MPAACVGLATGDRGVPGRGTGLAGRARAGRAAALEGTGEWLAGLRHRLADLHVLVESARSLSRAAAAAAGEGGDEGPDLGRRAAAVKVYCSDVLTRTAGEMIQLHGAIGITWEHPAHRYLKRAHGARHLFGPPDRHAAAVAASLLDR